MKQMIKKADLLLIGGVLLAIGVLLLILYGGKSNVGVAARVEIDGETVDLLPLSEDAERTYFCADGGKNTVTVKDGAVSVTCADCPDLICVRHRAVRRSGESIICLPHKLIVTVVGETVPPEVDAVA